MGVVCFNCLKCSVYIRRIGLVLLNRRILLLLSKIWNVWCSFRAHSIIITSMSSISTVYFLSYFIDVDDFFSEWFIFICLIMKTEMLFKSFSAIGKYAKTVSEKMQLRNVCQKMLCKYTEIFLLCRCLIN